jgi:N-acetylneuraminate synthase
MSSMRTDEAALIIAEAGVNHNGELSLAKQLIDVAADSGADMVKFQTFRSQQVVSRRAPKAKYQEETTSADESQLEMIQKLELSEQDHEVLIAHAGARGIAFLSTPFDVSSLHFLTDQLKLRIVKVASGEISNAPFLLAVARAAKEVILSTGMSTLAEVEAALGILAFGFISSKSAVPQSGDFERAFGSAAGQSALRKRVTLLHCTTEYPSPPGEANLRAINTMARAFALPVGFSDHTAGIHIALAAIVMGARVIEKHFTLNRSLSGPDHKASLEPDELKQLVRQSREIEEALGDGVKHPTGSEWPNREIARRSLVASRAIKAGELFTQENLTCKRPGTGVSPMKYWEYLGRLSDSSYMEDELI